MGVVSIIIIFVYQTFGSTQLIGSINYLSRNLKYLRYFNLRVNHLKMENNIMDNGVKELCKDKVNINFKMEINILVQTTKTHRLMAPSLGQMAIHTQVKYQTNRLTAKV